MRRVLTVGLLGLGALGLAACAGSGGASDPADEFGRRAEAENDARETLLIAPPDSAQEFFVYPAFASEVVVRSGPPEAGRRPVEVLIKGALPDACTELHDIAQETRGHLITMTFETRRPKGAVCAQVVRPYRFYYTLDEPLAPGDYTLKLNDGVHPFTVQPPPEEGR